MNSSKLAERPKPGLGILVLNKDNKILVGKRKDCLKYGIPGGYLERFESWHEGAVRELQEEVGVSINPDKLHVFKVYNAMSKEEKYHNVAIVLVTLFEEDQEIKNMEPEKCEGWEWWDINDLQNRLEDLFLPNRQLVSTFKDQLNPEFLNGIIKNPPKQKNCFFVTS